MAKRIVRRPDPKPVKGAFGPRITDQGAARGRSPDELIARHRGVPPGVGANPIFGEWSPPDYHATFNRIHDTKMAFEALPGRVRARFSNDPFQVIRFVDDPANRLEAVRLGLVVPTEEEAAVLHRASLRSSRVEQLDLEDEIASARARAARVKAAEEDPS